MKNHEENAKKMFTKHMDKTENQIVYMELINEGFTNISYLVVNQQNQKFQVRIGNHQINRNNEALFLKAMADFGGFIYYDNQTGNAIKKWVEGRIPSINECRSEKFMKAFAKSLRSLQKLKISKKMTERDFYCFQKKADFKNLEHIWQKYDEIIRKYQNLPLIASHNDLRPSNLVWDDKKVSFLDFEWGTKNHNYWDLCNFLREIEYPLTNLESLISKHFKNLKLDIVLEFLFATTCFAYQWTFFPESNELILKYRNNVEQLMQKYYAVITNKKPMLN